MDRIRLISHPNPVPGVLPALDFIEKYVVRCPAGTAHQFWDTTAVSRRLDSRGQAVLAVKVKPTASTHMKSRGVYSVVRALLEHKKMPLKGNVNTCGLSQCVNPTHWKGPTPPVPYKLDPERGVVHVSDGSTIRRDVAVRLRGLDGVVHVARALPDTLPVLLCGSRYDPMTVLVVTEPVTCTKGC